MSDLREWLKDASLTEIEAELQKRDKEIERLEWVKNDHWVKVQNWSDRAVKAETALPEANKLLEQTIEVLEGFEKVATPDLPLPRIVITWWRAKARPHLTKLKER